MDIILNHNILNIIYKYLHQSYMRQLLREIEEEYSNKEYNKNKIDEWIKHNCYQIV